MSMMDDRALAALVALAHGTRLGVLRLLLRQGPDGLPAGEIARATSVPPSTLSSHLAQLEGAGLLRSCRLRHHGRDACGRECRHRTARQHDPDRGDAGARHVRGADRRRIDQRAYGLLPMARRIHCDLRPGGDDPRLPALQAGAGALWRRPLYHRGVLVHVVHVVRQPGGDHRPLAHRYLLRDHAGAHAGLHHCPADRRGGGDAAVPLARPHPPARTPARRRPAPPRPIRAPRTRRARAFCARSAPARCRCR